MLNVVLIGAGNLGFNFYREFYKNEKINLIQWYNKTLDIIKFANMVEIITTGVPRFCYFVGVPLHQKL